MSRTSPLTGEALLAAVTQSMIVFHEHYHERAPVTAKSRWMGDDLLACVLGGIYTKVEQTLIELERDAIVRENRSAFQNAMEHKFIAAVEQFSGRRVVQFVSSHHIGPDLEIELFFLDGPGTASPAAT